MTAHERPAFGTRVAELRRRRGLTQSELALAIGRTASWVSQVERGIQPVNRLDVLRLLADGLDVALNVLQPEAPDATGSDGVPAAQARNDLDQARLVMSGHPALDVVLGHRPTAHGDEPLDGLRGDVDRLWTLTHSGRFAELSRALAPLVPRLERVSRTASREERAEAFGLLARTYQALASAFVRQNQADAAWVAADRAIRAAEMAGDELGVFVGVFRLVHVFVRLRHLDQAEHTAATAINALAPQAESNAADTEELSVLGSLHLALALVHARSGQRAAAREQIARARAVADRVGDGRNDFNLEFGPVNVEIQAVSTAVELGDAGEALDIAGTVDTSGLSAERQARMLMDVGRAHAQRRQLGDALASLLEAESVAPEIIRHHMVARDVVKELLLMAGRGASPELRALADRLDAMT
ncbi:helix-turn-helix transcriptional regulator [Streptomyces sp. CRN 30]|uniref:helix-turn-helix transcriptional regulator n=1 Tax=Streptomyces sp. CRN 30 TaxID=3075613 RepID=UPI002A823931|nr:helix-turn-helix transcriptional regulator [Streptomyces sp. CRN 30]